jgi:hypothetical protein
MKETRLLALAVLLASANLVVAQPGVWMEMGDAPDGPNILQDTMGIGPLLELRGSLDRANNDHVDTYSIVVTDPVAFYASTSTHLGGMLPLTDALMDTRLWLWSVTTADGVPQVVLANDDDPFDPGTVDLASTISDPSTYAMLTTGVVHPTAAGVSLVANQKYLLSISTFDNDPEDIMNVDLANLSADFTALHGRNPQSVEFDHWENSVSSDEGLYVIALQGATFCQVPEPAVGVSLVGMMLLASAWCRRIRQRNRDT